MTKNWKSLVVLSLVAISSSAARAGDDIKEFVHETPGTFGATVGAGVIAVSTAARFGAYEVIDRGRVPGFSNGNPESVSFQAGQHFRDEGEKIARQRSNLSTQLGVEEQKYKILLERPTSHASQEETIAVSHVQDATIRPGFLGPKVTEHVTDASSDVVTTTNGVSRAAIEQHKKVEAIKIKIAELNSKLDVLSKKQTEIKGYLYNGSHGHYLTSKDRKILDTFKPRFEVARREEIRLGEVLGEKAAQKEVVRKVSNAVNWAGVAAWPVIGIGVSMNDARIESERREKLYQEQAAAQAAAAAAAQPSAAAAK